MDLPLKVLVLEDNDDLRSAFADTISKTPGMTACEASTLKEGAIIARLEPRFVVLADLMLDDASDMDAIYLMRKMIP